jgi:hypothetical protein
MDMLAIIEIQYEPKLKAVWTNMTVAVEIYRMALLEARIPAIQESGERHIFLSDVHWYCVNVVGAWQEAG